MGPPKSAKVTVAERILHLQDEWDEIADSPGDVELTGTQQAELDRRLEDHAHAPNDVVSWDEVKRELRTTR